MMKHRFTRSKTLVLLVGLLALGTLRRVEAGVFSTIQYLEPGQHSLGVEPEFVLSSGAGFGANFRYTTGLNDLSNAAFIIGTGGGPRQFRVGANLTADFFPDTDGQPGIGIALQAMWGRVSIQSAGTGMTAVGDAPTQGRFDLQLQPYIHNRFGNRGGDVEPFFAFPVGFSIRDGKFQSSQTVAVGSLFHMSRAIQYSMELNVGVNNAESTLSAGFLYTFE